MGTKKTNLSRNRITSTLQFSLFFSTINTIITQTVPKHTKTNNSTTLHTIPNAENKNIKKGNNKLRQITKRFDAMVCLRICSHLHNIVITKRFVRGSKRHLSSPKTHRRDVTNCMPTLPSLLLVQLLN